MADGVVKVVLVGCGGMANHWVEIALRAERIELVGLVDVRRAAAEAMAARHGLPGSVVFDSLKEAVAATGAQAVFDVTIPEAHDRVTIEALGLGCHVLGEKPLSVSLERAQRVVKAAQAADRLYAVTQTRRPIVPAMSISQALRDGVLGDVQEVHSDFYIGARFGAGERAGDFRRTMEQVLIVDMAVHTFDTARQLSGADPVSVYCQTWNPGRSWYEGDASACAIFEMKLPGGEPVMYTYRGSWCNEGMHTDWNAAWRISGQRGTLTWNGGGGIEAELVADENDPAFMRRLEKVEIPRVELPHTGHEFLIREFADCVVEGTGYRKGRQPQCPCDDNIRSFAMVMAAVASAKRGERVAVEVGV